MCHSQTLQPSWKKVEVKKAVSKDELMAAAANRGIAPYIPQGSRMPSPASYGRGIIYSGSSYGSGDGSSGWYQGFAAGGGNNRAYPDDGFGNCFNSPYGEGYGGVGPTRGRGIYTPRGAGPYGGTYGSQW